MTRDLDALASRTFDVLVVGGGIHGLITACDAACSYGVAWLLGVPTSLIVLWFLANQMGCGF